MQTTSNWMEEICVERIWKQKLIDQGFFQIQNLGDDCDYLSFLKRFGVLIPQYDGKIVFQITPDPRFLGTYFSKTKEQLYPHTEAYEFKIPPKYLALFCVNPDRDGNGLTELCDFRPFYENLSSEVQKWFREKKHWFHPNSGLQKTGFQESCSSPLLDPQTQTFRYSYNNCKGDPNDPFLSSILDDVLNYYQKNKNSLFLEKGDLLVFDNHRMLHGRTSFNDPSRCLERVWITER